MKIGLFGIEGNRGPGKVFQNLIKGLQLLGHDVIINGYSDYNGSLCHGGNHPTDMLMGPNVMVIPPDLPDYWEKYKNWVVPSQWVLDLYRSFDITKNSNIHIWSAGIDTDKFIPQKNIQYDCLIYFKNRDHQELNNVINFLNNKKLTFNVLRYGSYSENELIDLCNKSKFGILIDNTESQGIAIMEMMSLDLPIYVLDCKIWNGRTATSVPYFDERCGIISMDMNLFDNFYINIGEYEPRKYILENHTLMTSAQKYIDILKIIK